ncbi:hypothetical protein BVC80_41g35 [Macleaya cordata]|uniref:Uncharacterized protein n=1 Tax=Macleaya cordata TaxID=56857 RepID=A0A200QMS4_MACCD|nr:hypothetical protein BVC80_41g35 [Macleaya cordata]
MREIDNRDNGSGGSDGGGMEVTVGIGKDDSGVDTKEALLNGKEALKMGGGGGE